MILLVIGLSLTTFLSNPSVIKNRIASLKNKKMSKQAVWKVLVIAIVSCCLIPFGGADSNNKVRAKSPRAVVAVQKFWLVTHFILLQALGIDQDKPFTLDKGMDKLRSLRHGSKNQDPSGIMMQVKSFAKVSTQVHIN